MPTELTQHNSIDRYMASINRYSLLSRGQETEIARRYRKTGDAHASHQLICANLRFVVRIAHEFAGYKVPLIDLIQEGNLGLVVAVKKFDPDKGYRLISYAVWWIRAYMWSCAMRSFSMIKLGTTQAQRKLFFVLRAARERAEHAAGPGESVSHAELARELGVQESDVNTMAARLSSRDLSLDAAVEPSSHMTHLDGLIDDKAGTETVLEQAERENLVRKHLRLLGPGLSEREGYIVAHRLLAEPAQTFREIGLRFDISRERVRQIEGTVLRKIRSHFVQSRDFRQAVA